MANIARLKPATARMSVANLKVVEDKSAPDGYTEEWDCELWNAGTIFRWSDVYECWLHSGTIGALVTVKPGQTLSEAFEDHMDHPMWDEFSVFFSDEA